MWKLKTSYFFGGLKWFLPSVHTFFHVGNSYDLDGYVELSQTFLRHPIVLQLDTRENKHKSWRNLKEECNLGIFEKILF